MTMLYADFGISEV